MAEDELKDLIAKRGIVRGKLTKFTNYLVSYEPTEIVQLQMRYDRCSSLLDDFEQYQDRIEILLADDQDEIAVHRELRDKFEDDYFREIAKAKQFLLEQEVRAEVRNSAVSDISGDRRSQASSARTSSRISNAQPASGVRANVKLPRIELPTFSGSYDQWLSFYDTFDALINGNSDLPAIEKYYYLRSSLKGEAADVIASLEVSSANYVVAWDLLKGRFENKKLMVHNHIKAIFDIEVVHRESHLSIRSVLDNLNKNIRALKVLELPTDHWDALLIHLLSSKLPEITRREWETSAGSKQMPTLAEFTTFLTNRAQLLEKIESTRNPTYNKNNSSTHSSQKVTGKHSHSFMATSKNCHFCNQSHYLYHCKEFLNLHTKDKYAALQRVNVCANCLRSGHNNKKCNFSKCRKCDKPHNTLLHDDHYKTNNAQSVQASNCSDKTNKSGAETGSATEQLRGTERPVESSVKNSFSAVAAYTTQKCDIQVILSTAVVHICDKFGNFHEARVLLDSGSQSNFISKDLCDKLQLTREKLTFTVVGGLNQATTNVSFCVQATIKSRFSSFKIESSFLVLNNITERIPLAPIDISRIRIPEHVSLADPDFHLPKPIDVLLGASIFWDIVGSEQIRLSKSLPILQQTHMGWIVSGAIQQPRVSRSTTCYFSNTRLHDQLETFWHIEECELKTQAYSAEEEMCEENFKNTHIREEDGRFQVSLPFRVNKAKLGASKEAAVKRLKAMERKFDKQPMLFQQYSNFMQEYLQLEHMELVNEADVRETTHYLAHHAVFKQDSTTTKLRCVFDGSSKTSNGISLNDILMVGPVVQRDLYSILISFRQHAYAMTADIAKMYRQVNVKPEDTDVQHILWRFSKEDPIREYKLKTVTYGLGPSAFLATRCLKQLAIEHQNSSPKAAGIIQECFYVDDLLVSCDTIEEIAEIKQAVTSILGLGQFQLRKWKSNTPVVMSNGMTEPWQVSESKVDSKTLGISWHAEEDVFLYLVKPNKVAGTITKRTLLSLISQIFDPLGLVAPVTIRAKILMQELWKQGISWDEPVSEDIAIKWNNYAQQLHQLNDLSFPRHIGCYHLTKSQLHGFSDASEVAYGAVVYYRTTDQNNEHFVKLVSAKTKVAPLKKQSIPRLELCSALLLAKLYQSVIKAMDVSADQTFFWSDSTIALTWIKGEPSQWKTFIGNRVSKIQSMTDKRQWGHVGTNENPADLLSRGTTPEQLAGPLWQNGPVWLQQDQDKWPKSRIIEVSDIPERNRERQVFHNVNLDKDFYLDMFTRFSSLIKLQRVVAYILRFKDNALKTDNSNKGPLTVTELQNALYKLIKLAQHQIFSDEVQCLLKNKHINKRSKLVSLNTYLDSSLLLRVGGRLQHSLVSYDQKHPLVLPSSHPLTDLIIMHYHKKYLHAGPQALLASIRLQFWPISGKNNIKRVLRKCTVCFRCNPHSYQRIMGQLPAERTIPARPFQNCGLDYAGPFITKSANVKSKTVLKTYLCVFVCFATKAVHLELVSDLTTTSFLNTLKRFVARRGLISDLYSDNATNFVGAHNELKSVYKFLSKNKANFSEYLANESIRWHFIPARSPHMGGLWEATVKSAKFHLKRVVGNQVLTFEELYTVVCQIESCLNSRPLCPMSDNPTDMNPLCPSHFLIGDSFHSVPQTDHTDLKVNRLTRYQMLTQMFQHFWVRWSQEYLTQLQSRYKWQKGDNQEIQINTLVILKEENYPPLLWHMGRVVKLHPGADGHVRVVTVKTKNGLFKRAVTKLCPLPNNA